MKVRTSIARRMIAVASSAALCCGMAVAASTVAYAADGDLGAIKTDRQGSITLHKHESGSQTVPGRADGVNDADITGKGVRGVVFTAYKVTNLDLKKTADWQTLHGLQIPANACDGTTPQVNKLTFGETKFAFPATDVNGDTTKGQLAVGAYLICETTGSATAKKSEPFLVTIPQPGVGAGSWVYDVHAYPKSTVVNAPTKTTTVDQLGIGGSQQERQATFTIRTRVPFVAERTQNYRQDAEYFKYFIIGDSLTQGYTNPQIVSVNVADDAHAAGTGVNTNHYTKTGESATSQWATVVFNKEGLQWLRSQGGKYIVVTMKANVTEVPTDGQLNNTGYLMLDVARLFAQPDPTQDPFNEPRVAGGEPTPKAGNPDASKTNKSMSVWGRIEFTKVAANTGKAPLKGAEFEVYEGAVKDGGECTKATANNTPIRVNNKTKFASNERGIVSIPGLLVGTADAVGAAEPNLAVAHKCYVLKEVTAPVGYVKPEGDNALTAVKVVPGKAAKGSVSEITNTQIAVPTLPLTGAQGTVLMTLVGSSLMLAAAGIAALRRQRA